jgi:anti-sigma factor ChrR (cupin superfamily)
MLQKIVANKQIYLNEVFEIANDPDRITWEHFRDGIKIHRIYKSESAETSVALLRLSPGAKVPRHIHNGHEFILVLSGSQTDENAPAKQGTLIVSPPGSSHSVYSDDDPANDLIVLAIWEKPVSFV